MSGKFMRDYLPDREFPFASFGGGIWITLNQVCCWSSYKQDNQSFSSMRRATPASLPSTPARTTKRNAFGPMPYCLGSSRKLAMPQEFLGRIFPRGAFIQASDLMVRAFRRKMRRISPLSQDDARTIAAPKLWGKRHWQGIQMFTSGGCVFRLIILITRATI